MDYSELSLVLFANAVESACGVAGSAVGPFYCPGDQQVYLDRTLFEALSQQLDAPGDFARAYGRARGGIPHRDRAGRFRASTLRPIRRGARRCQRPSGLYAAGAL
jgi:hypothetical protein